MNLQVQSSLSSASSFEEIFPIVERAWEDITFWGFRYVSAIGYSGKVHIDYLAVRVVEIIKNNPNFTEKERGYGKSIVSLINRIYNVSDERFKTKNIITRIFWNIRNTVYLYQINSQGPRFHWEEGRENRIFDLYTSKQYKELFKKDPDLGNPQERFWKDGEYLWPHP